MSSSEGLLIGEKRALPEPVAVEVGAVDHLRVGVKKKKMSSSTTEARRRANEKRRHYKEVWSEKFGLMPHPPMGGSEVMKATCGFCVVFGPEGTSMTGQERKRKQTKRKRVFKFPFRQDNIKRHMQVFHPKRFAEYQAMTADQKKVFLEGNSHGPYGRAALTALAKVYLAAPVGEARVALAILCSTFPITALNDFLGNVREDMDEVNRVLSKHQKKLVGPQKHARAVEDFEMLAEGKTLKKLVLR